MISKYILFFSIKVRSLSWKCEYNELNSLTNRQFSNVLYKEDNQNVVKWLEKVDYCRSKGDNTIYTDAGQGKCEFSRGICIWETNTCIQNPLRTNDPLNQCVDLLNQNVLQEGLDSGRIEILMGLPPRTTQETNVTLDVSLQETNVTLDVSPQETNLSDKNSSSLIYPDIIYLVFFITTFFF